MIVIHVLAPHTFEEKKVHKLEFVYNELMTFVDTHSTKPPLEIFKQSATAAQQLSRRSHKPNLITGGSVMDFQRIIATKRANSAEFIPAVYPEDTILDLKRKVATVTKIATFRQHLYRVPTEPLSYSILVSGKMTVFNILDTATWSTIENIPINSDIYGIRSAIMIDANDEFSICANLIPHMVKKTLHLYVLDLLDYISPHENKAMRLAMREHFEKIVSNNTYYMDLIYASFVQIFFPCITRTTFAEFISSGLMDIIPKYITLRAEHSVLHTYHTRAVPYPDIHCAITACRFTVIHNMQFNPAVLFDIIRLTDTVTQVAICSKENIIIKYRSDLSIIHTNPKPTQVVINIMSRRKSQISIILIIDKLNYSIITTWPEHQFLLFSDIIRVAIGIINPVIVAINRHGNEIFSNMPMQLPLLSIHNAIQTRTSVSITWNASVVGDDITRFEGLLSDWKYAGIIREHQSTTYVSEFYLNKGIYVADIRKLHSHVDIHNTYAYMSVPTVYNRWQMLFKRSKRMRIHYQQNSVKFELVNVRDAEFKIFEFYICQLIYDANATLKWKSSMNFTKKIRRLKENDPVAFGERGYSEACQQNKQPIGYSVAEYNDLSVSARANKIKYTNFTTNENYYYGCPTKENPHLYFITGVHPDNICLPCCKSLPIQNPEKLKKYTTCLRHHKYTDVGAETMSKYVINFREDIPINRLSYLPPDTIDLLMHGESDIIPANAEVITNRRYYAIGVKQNAASVARCGFLFCILQIFSITVVDFINMIKDFLIKHPVAFHSILDSKLPTYFADVESFVTNLHSVFVNGDISIIKPTPKHSKWNTIFRDFAKFIFNINFILFVSQPEYQLIIPENVSAQYYTRVAIIIQTGTSFYPVFGVNIAQYIADGSIEQRIYTATDDPIRCIKLILPPVADSRTIPLSFIASNFNIEQTYTNMVDIIYGVTIDGVFISVPDTLYDTSYANRNITVPTYSEYADIMRVLARINECIAVYSAEQGLFKQSRNNTDPLMDQVIAIYNYIVPTEIYIYNDKQVGMICGNIPYFHKPCAPALNLPVIKLTIDPRVFNTSIYTSAPPPDIGISGAIHTKFEYNLVLLQYNNHFNSERNIELRADFAAGNRSKFNELERAVLRQGTDYGLPFDRVSYNKLAELIQKKDRAGANKLLAGIGKSIFTAYSDNSVMANVLSTSNYSIGGKLSIHLDKLPMYIEVLLADLFNPLIGLSVFMVIDRVVDSRKFELPVGEKIKFIPIKTKVIMNV